MFVFGVLYDKDKRQSQNKQDKAVQTKYREKERESKKENLEGVSEIFYLLTLPAALWPLVRLTL